MISNLKVDVRFAASDAQRIGRKESACSGRQLVSEGGSLRLRKASLGISPPTNSRRPVADRTGQVISAERSMPPLARPADLSSVVHRASPDPPRMEQAWWVATSA